MPPPRIQRKLLPPGHKCDRPSFSMAARGKGYSYWSVNVAAFRLHASLWEHDGYIHRCRT